MPFDNFYYTPSTQNFIEALSGKDDSIYRIFLLLHSPLTHVVTKISYSYCGITNLLDQCWIQHVGASLSPLIQTLNMIYSLDCSISLEHSYWWKVYQVMSIGSIFNVPLFNCYIIKVFVLHVMCSKVVSSLTLSLHQVEASFLISRKHLNILSTQLIAWFKFSNYH